ncbi:MAG: hypothetical protein WBA67_15600 [Jannaschia sp.]
MRYVFLSLAAMSLVACQSTAPEVEVDDAARRLTNACLAEIGKPILPDRVTESANIELTEEERATFTACVQRLG